jgi:hypothetical protein
MTTDQLRTPQTIAQRLEFSALLLTELSTAIEANALALPAGKDATEMQATAAQLTQIACVHYRLALSIKRKHQNSSKKQVSAAIGSTPGGPERCATD